jgi:hypothetical protein
MSIQQGLIIDSGQARPSNQKLIIDSGQARPSIKKQEPCRKSYREFPTGSKKAGDEASNSAKAVQFQGNVRGVNEGGPPGSHATLRGKHE